MLVITSASTIMLGIGVAVAVTLSDSLSVRRRVTGPLPLMGAIGFRYTLVVILVSAGAACLTGWEPPLGQALLRRKTTKL